MKKTDARTIAPSAQYELRKEVVHLKQAGRSGREISKITGLSPEHISRVWGRFKKEGQSAIMVKTRGRRVGAKRILSQEQENTLRGLIIDKSPAQLNFPSTLWTRQAVQFVSEKRYKVKIALRTTSTYLKRWGFSPQKPMTLACEHKAEAAKAWLAQSYPGIARRARAEGAEINWGDESGVEAGGYTAKGDAPKGQLSSLSLAGGSKHIRVNLLSARSNQGKIRFMLFRENIGSKLFIKFMAGLIKEARKKIFLIVGNRAYNSQAVARWLARPEIKGRLELFFLPSCFPELKPGESLNSGPEMPDKKCPPGRNQMMKPLAKAKLKRR